MEVPKEVKGDYVATSFYHSMQTVLQSASDVVADIVRRCFGRTVPTRVRTGIDAMHEKGDAHRHII